VQKVIIIAEAGVNHNGDINLAKKLIDEAVIAGADYVKFQLYDAERTSLTDPERDWFFRVQVPQNV